MTETFPETEKVRVLLTEHSGLRAEVTARTGHGFQLLAIGTTAVSILVALASKQANDLIVGLIVIIGGAFGAAAYFTLRDIYRAAARIKEIELEVNYRVGEDLMTWETLWSPAATGFWKPAKKLPRSRLRDMPIPERTKWGEPINSISGVTTKS